MRIDCYLSPECASEEALRENITRALATEKVEAELNFHRIDDKKALALGITGSPSVFINGKELQPQGVVGFS
jgi:protein-disulfide isomerase